ncbi:MAG: hemolysin family protein [Pseudomonadota bacterium]
MSPDTPSAKPPAVAPARTKPSRLGRLFRWLRDLREGERRLNPTREKLSALMEEAAAAAPGTGEAERRLLANILSLRRRTVADVKIPRAAIVAVEAGVPFGELVEMLVRENHSRLPVYRETLDDVIGMIHIKDVLAWRGRESEFALTGIMRKILFVAPSMHVLELLLEMRVKRIHMALVVDEFGGVDGLVTIEDLVEEIVGEIEDEHDVGDRPMLARLADGAFEADADVTLGEFERESGMVFSDEDRGEVETLGGLVVAAAGQVPIRGQLVRHASGLEFEVLDADPRRIKRLRIHRRSPAQGAKA